MEITLSNGARRLIKPTLQDILLVENLNVRKIKKSKTTNLQGNIVVKPWGIEYLCGRNKYLEVWELYINPKSATSFHCHPEKDTLNIVLQGTIQLRTIKKQEILKAGDFRLLKAGAIHKTTNLNSKSLARVLEIESPPNKYNLIRIKDDYGRENLGYVKPYTKKSCGAPMHKCLLNNIKPNKGVFYALRTFIPQTKISKQTSAVYELSLVKISFKYPKNELLKELESLGVKNLILTSGSVALSLYRNRKIVKLLPGNCLFDIRLQEVDWSARTARLLLW